MASPALKQILIVGGSYSGISIAHYILKHAIPTLPNSDSYQVILISASSQTMCRPACPRALISDAMFPQDKLWATFREALPSVKSILIAGGGPAGIETAGELGDHLNGREAAGWFSNSTRPTPKVAIKVVTASSQILPILRPSLALKAETYLSQLGVTVVKNARIKTVSPEGAGTKDVAAKTTATLDDGSTLSADLYIPATGLNPNTWFISPSLLGPDSKVSTNASTLRVDGAGPRIYAIGDVASYARPAIHLILEAVPVLGANMKRDLLHAARDKRHEPSQDKSEQGKLGGEEEKKRDDGDGQCDRIYAADKRETQMVPIGRNKGVGAAMGYALPSFLVWAVKGRDYWLWTTGGLWSGRQWGREK